MKYFVTTSLVVLLIYLLSFAMYNWNEKNKPAAIGSVLLGITAFGIGIYIMFFGNYEM